MVILQSDSDDPIDSQCSEIEVRRHSSEMRAAFDLCGSRAPATAALNNALLSSVRNLPGLLPFQFQRSRHLTSHHPCRNGWRRQAPPCAKHLSRNRPHAIGEHATRDANAIHVRRLAPAGPFAASALRRPQRPSSRAVNRTARPNHRPRRGGCS